MGESLKKWVSQLLGDSGSDLQIINRLVVPSILAAFFTIIWRFGFDSQAAAGTIWGIACLFSGGLVGFLFGIPRLSGKPSDHLVQVQAPAQAQSENRKSKEQMPDSWQSNSNLVEISDWLTKIIVGLGLINLQKIPTETWKMASDIAKSIDQKNPASIEAFVLGLIVATTLIGFIAGYLYTRIFLQGAFVRADKKDFFARELDRQVSDASNATPSQQKGDESPTSLPTSEEIERAEKVERLATSPQDQSTTIEKMKELAREYEQTRMSMPSGDARTQEMTKCVLQMRSLALAAYPALPQFAKSSSPGERLAAIAMLQTRLEPEFIPWLANCLIEEVPFLGYHSALALYRGAKILGEPGRSLIRTGIEGAIEALVAKKYRDRNRDEVLQGALKELQTINGIGEPQGKVP